MFEWSRELVAVLSRVSLPDLSLVVRFSLGLLLVGGRVYSNHLKVLTDWWLWSKPIFTILKRRRDESTGEVRSLSKANRPPSLKDSYLVDPASSHMLVSKIKPCMSKYKHFILWNCEWLIKSVIVYLIVPYYLDNRGNSRANTCIKSRLSWKGCIY